jgi:2-dehydropantoate 2-reductase
MRVAIYGTGGAGGYFGAQLARSGEDVTFIARGEHLKAIQAHGLCVETPAGEILIQPAKATDDPKEVGPVDVILLGVKAWQVEEAAGNMKPMVGPATFVVSRCRMESKRPRSWQPFSVLNTCLAASAERLVG